MELSKKTYIKGENSPEKLENLMKIAKEFHGGNWSELVLESIIGFYDLDPDTCAPRAGKVRRLASKAGK